MTSVQVIRVEDNRLYLYLGLGVSMMSHITVTNFHTLVTCHNYTIIYHKKHCRRFWNNNVVRIKDSRLVFLVLVSYFKVFSIYLLEYSYLFFLFLFICLLQNELLTCLWYLNLRCTLRDLGVIQKFKNNDNDD